MLKLPLRTYLVFLLFILLETGAIRTKCQVLDLRCEYLDSPIAIDSSNPRFTWRVNSTNEPFIQQSYRLIVSTDSLFTTVIWDAGRKTSQSQIVVYEGPVLASHSPYYWRVEVLSKSGTPYTSDTAVFTTGFLDKDWTGNWISDKYDKDFRPASVFRKAFPLTKRVSNAILYIASAGLHDAKINGLSVSDQILNPVFTQLDKRLFYNAYDVTDLLAEKNVIVVTLGNGWFNYQAQTAWKFDGAKWRARPKFILNLRVEFEDGTSTVLESNESWRHSQSGVLFNSIYVSENHDYSLDNRELFSYEMDDSAWSPVSLEQAPRGSIVAQNVHPIRVTEVLMADNMKKFNDFHYTFLFPKNVSGYSKIKFQSEARNTVTIIHGEQLNSDGNVNLGSLGEHYVSTDPLETFQTDYVHTTQNQSVSHHPLFNYKGFQYVMVKSTQAIDLSKDDVTAQVIHSDLPRVGYLTTSSATLNSIYEASNNSFISNMMGYPTDCPQREKNGWTGDAQLMVGSGLFTYDALLEYEKWAMDHSDSQTSDGQIPVIVPSSDWGYETKTMDWTNSMVIVPWEVYLFSGDNTVLKQHYEAMSRYMSYWAGRSKNYLVKEGFGDWKAPFSMSDVTFTTSVLYYQNALIMEKVAGNLGYKGDASDYKRLSEGIRRALNSQFIEKGKLKTQTELSMALYYDVPYKELIKGVSNQLFRAVKESNFHLDVGLLGSKTLLPAISKYVGADVAYEVSTKSDFPSWNTLISEGKTLKESWDKTSKDVYYGGSRNHTYLGSINEWMYQYLAGIQIDESRPGFSHIIFDPIYPTELSSVSASHLSLYGEVVSGWEKQGDNLTQKIEVPANASGSYRLPTEYHLTNVISSFDTQIFLDGTGKIAELPPGKYEFNFSKTSSTDYKLYSSTDYGILTAEKNEIVFVKGMLDIEEGMFQVLDVSGKVLKEKHITQFNPRNVLLDLDDHDLPQGIVLIMKLVNSYPSVGVKQFSLKILKR